MKNQIHCKTVIALAIGALLAGPVFAVEPTNPPTNTTAAPSNALTEQEVGTKIADAGFKEVKGLQFKNGIWKADARGGDEKWVAVYVHPLTGKVFQEGKPSPLSEDDIKAKVTAGGYQNVHDVEFKNGLWKAEADNGKGKEVDLLIDPDDGSVIGESND